LNSHDHILRRINEANGGDESSSKVTRDAFLYLDPKEPNDKFAQCETCMMWTGSEHNTCTIIGLDEEVKATDSCGLYVHGDPVPEEAGNEMKLVTKEEAGFVSAAVRCENCGAFDGNSICVMFEDLNKMSLFSLNTKVDAKGCCNAWHPKG
jgi:hypothetical protein